MAARGFFSWDRGACSKRTDADLLLETLVSKANDTIQNSLAEDDSWSAATQANVRTEAQTALWRGDRSEPAGGLALRFRIDVSQTGVTFPYYIPVPYSAEVHADVTAGYRWIARDGVLGVEPLRTKVTDNYGDTAVLIGINGPSSHADGKLGKGLTQDVPVELSNSARDQQLYEVKDLSRGGAATACVSESDCVDGVSGALSFLKNQLNNASKTVSNFSALISADEAVRLKAVLTNSSEWVCASRNGASAKTCNLLTRAKRVNAYPNGIELVFREGGERPMTREFALEIVARAAVAQGLATSNPMCDAPTHGAAIRMNFVNKVQYATYD